MAILDTSVLTYDRKGLREQLSDVIYNVSPEDTPLLSMLAKGMVKGVLFEWQTDALRAAVTTNAQLEGQNYAVYPRPGASVRVGNYQQISHGLFSISGTVEEVEKAGRSSEINYQTIKEGAAIKLDQEATLFNAQGGVAGDDTTARTTAALLAWIKTNVDKAADGDNPAWTSGVPAAARTDGTQRAFTETIFKNVMQLGWNNGAKFKYVFAGPVNKQKASAFSGVAQFHYDVTQAKPGAVIFAADVFVSDFGTVTILPTRNQREQDVWFCDPSMLSIQHLRPFKREEMAKTGDARNFALRTEWGLKVNNELAQGLAADLTTT